MAPRLGVAILVAALAASRALGQTTATNERAVVVISDLHMGIGRDASGAWHPYEDFRWAPEFSSFLEAVNSEGKRAVDLVLNGDAFDLVQSAAKDCANSPEVGCTEAEAVARLDRVLTAHQAEIAAARNFARAGSNRVVFVPGDSDAALLFPAVERRLLGAFNAPATRVEVARQGFWLSRDGRIHAEHGHQIGLSAHRFENWPAPFIRRDGREHLIRPLGERIAGGFYERLEGKYPVVDNLAMLGTGVKYALAADGVTDAGELAPDLLKYQLFETMSWQQFRMELDDGDVEPPLWDIAQVRSQGGAMLVSTLPEDDPFRRLAARALADGRLDPVVRSLTDEAIVALCDYRAAVRRARRRFEPAVSQFAPRGPVIAECPRTPETRGAIFDYFWRSRDLTLAKHLESLNARLPVGAKPTVFVHGHSHLADRSQTNANMISGGLLKIPSEGFSPVRGALTPIVINGGAWQRTLTPVQLERVLPDRELRSLQPEDLAPCYSFVQIPAYHDTPAPTVRYWQQNGSGAWALAAACSR